MSRRNSRTSDAVVAVQPCRSRARTARISGRAAITLVVATFAVGLGVVPAGADDDLTVNPDEIISAEPGSVVTVAEEPIPAQLVGQVCTVRIATANGSSVHPGNVAIVATGDHVVETPGVEDSPEGQVTHIDSLTLGETLSIRLRLGPEGLSSLGFSVVVDCPEPATAPAQVASPPEQTTPQVSTAEETPEESTPTVLPAQQVAPPADPVTANPTFTG